MLPGFDGQQSCQRFQQGSLACSVGSKQSDARAACQLNVQMMDSRNPVIRDRQIFDEQPAGHGADSGMVKTS